MTAGVIDSLCNERRSAILYIWEETRAPVHSRVIRRAANIRGAPTHQSLAPKQAARRARAADGPLWIQYRASRGRLLTKRRAATLDTSPPSPLG